MLVPGPDCSLNGPGTISLYNISNQELEHVDSWINTNYKLTLNIIKTNFIIFQNPISEAFFGNLCLCIKSNTIKKVSSRNFRG